MRLRAVVPDVLRSWSATGILLTRLTGLIRQRVFAHYFGLGAEADAFSAAFRIPNVLQNLFGEGALSASFIPVYASLVAQGGRRDADRVAGAVLSLLALVVSAIVLAGVLATPMLIDLIAPGFDGGQRALTIQLVRILFPGAGLLVLSAWCLGVLNSHRRFLLSYTAPVMWNAAMIATLVVFGGQATLPRLAVFLAWGSVAGSALQCAVQFPAVLRVAPGLRLSPPSRSSADGRESAQARARSHPQLRAVVRQPRRRSDQRVRRHAAGQPAADRRRRRADERATSVHAADQPVRHVRLGRGASRVVGDSIGAGGSAIPERGADPGVADVLRRRLDAGLRQIAFFVVPSAVAFIALGDVIAAAVFETGRFDRADAVYVWAILAGSAIGLLPVDARPAVLLDLLRAARHEDAASICRSSGSRSGRAGYLFARSRCRDGSEFQRCGGRPVWRSRPDLAGWVEMLLLRRTLNRRIGSTGVPATIRSKTLGIGAWPREEWRGRSKLVRRFIQRSRPLSRCVWRVFVTSALVRS